VQPLRGLLVVDLTLLLPGPFASRELLRLGARVVRIEPPGGDPMRSIAPAWHDALNAGKESVVADLKAEPDLGRALLRRADVVLTSFRPGVAERLGLGAGDLSARTVFLNISGFGPGNLGAGHDLNYLGWAGALADTAPALPPLPVADLASGSLTAVARVLAALLERERTGAGSRLDVSMTDESHNLVAHRVGGEPTGRMLTGGLACYRVYGTADGRQLTLAALEERFFRRLCELIERPDLVAFHWQAGEQERLAGELEAVFAARPLSDWLDRFDGEDVCVGPVATLAEAASRFGGGEDSGAAPALGEHNEAWQRELAA
jgi:alpha-methylacyl-CoA racemase